MASSRVPEVYYGGQAVIEGVMIRGPRQMAIAVRAPDGGIVTRAETLASIYTGPLRRLPVLRGIFVLWETLVLGMRALTWSSQVAAGIEPRDATGWRMVLPLGVALSFAAGLFFAGPVLITGWVGEVTGSGFIEVLSECVLRLVMLVGYIWAIGRLPEIRRVFAYHGAEHRTIHAYEHGEPLVASSIRQYPNAHPRCGTAFLLTVMVLSLFVFIALGTPPLWVRLIERIVLIPAVAAVAYEVLRLGQRFGDGRVFGLIYGPNIWLQRMTTRDPDDAQIEVAITALRAALALEEVVEQVVPASVLEAEEPIA